MLVQIEAPILYSESFEIDLLCDRLATNGYACLTDLFSEDLLENLFTEIRNYDQQAELKPAGTGRDKEHSLRRSLRSDKTRWIEGTSQAEQQFLATLENLRVDINRRLMLGLFDVEATYAVYHPGSFYRKHYDSFKGSRNRLLSTVLYLNKDWTNEDGGQLLIFEEGSGHTPVASVMPEWGNIVMFLSEAIPHEVCKTKRSRYSIAAWYRCNQG